MAFLDDLPDYQAISYAWGNTDLTQQLFFPAGSLWLTASLYGALRRFREEDRPVRLWADAICINQDDFAEKNIQVDIMHRIYSQAEGVKVWLGESVRSDPMAFWTLEKLAEPVHDNNKLRYFESLAAKPERHVSCLCCEERFYMAEDPCVEALASLRILGSRPWFRRVWVVQEAMLSKALTFYCGRHTISSLTLIHGLTLHEQYEQSYGRSLPLDMSLLSIIAIAVCNRRNEDPYGVRSKRRLLQMLVKTSSQCATDVRDRVFAIRKVANVVDVQQLRPEYSGSADDLWLKMMIYLMNEYKDLHQDEPHPSVALGLVGMQDERSPEVPSWVPDFDGLSKHALLKLERASSPIFSAGGRESFCALPIPGEPKCISFIAKHFAIVHAVSEGTQSSPDAFRGSLADAYKNDLDTTAALETKVLPWYVQCRRFAFQNFGRDGTKDAQFRSLLHYGSTAMNELSYKPYRHIITRTLALLRRSGEPFLDPREVFEDLAWRLMIRADDEVTNPTWILMITDDGHLGWVSERARPGDHIFLFRGGPLPFVLRARDDGTYKVIGDAYVQGIMNGEAWPEDEKELEEVQLR